MLRLVYKQENVKNVNGTLTILKTIMHKTIIVRIEMHWNYLRTQKYFDQFIAANIWKCNLYGFNIYLKFCKIPKQNHKYNVYCVWYNWFRLFFYYLNQLWFLDQINLKLICKKLFKSMIMIPFVLNRKKHWRFN